MIFESILITNLDRKRLCELLDNTDKIPRNIELKEAANEISELTFDLPMDNPKSEFIQNENMVFANNQYYLIKESDIVYGNDGTRLVSVICRHLSSTLADQLISHGEIEPMPLVNLIKAALCYYGDTPTLGWSVGEITVKDPSAYRGLEEADESVFTTLSDIASKYDGVLEFDSVDMKVNMRAANDKSNPVAVFKASRNLKEFDIKYDTSELYTRLYCFGAEDSEGNKVDIMSVNPTGLPYIDNFSYFKALGYTDDYIKSHPEMFVRQNIWENSSYSSAQDVFNEGKKQSEKYSMPKTTINITGIHTDTAFGEKLAALKVGDCVKVYNEDLDVTILCNVSSISYTHDEYWLINIEVTEDLVTDSIVTNIINSVSQVVDKNTNTLIADKIVGIINGINAQLKVQRNAAKKIEARPLFMEDIDPNSPLFGATCWGTNGIEFSKRRSGNDWVWDTAMNANGIIATAIITGILSDRFGKFYLDMDTGELRMKDGTFTGTLQGSAFNGGSINIGNSSFLVDGNGNVTMKKGSISIGGKFSVDSAGNMKATNGNFTGKIDAESGTVGGWTIRNNVMVKEFDRYLDYTAADYEAVKQIILRDDGATESEIKKYDIDYSGYISSADYAIIKNIVDGVHGRNWRYTFTLNPSDPFGIMSMTLRDLSSGFTRTENMSIGSASIESINGIRKTANNSNFRKDVTANSFGLNGSGSLYGVWADAKKHDIVSHDGYLTAYFGAGDFSNETVTNLRGKYVKLYNHSGGYCRVNNAAITSDRNLKTDFRNFTKKHEDFFMKLNPQIFKYENGTAKRDHFGFVAQDVEQALTDSGLSTEEFAGVIIDKGIAKTEDDVEVNFLVDKGISEMHLLRMEEFISLNTHMLQNAYKRIEELEKRIKTLEEGEQ